MDELLLPVLFFAIACVKCRIQAEERQHRYKKKLDNHNRAAVERIFWLIANVGAWIFAWIHDLSGIYIFFSFLAI